MGARLEGLIAGICERRAAMTVGKGKKMVSKKKGAKKEKDPFLRKEWYHIKAPSVFTERSIGRTVVTKTTGTKVARDSLLGRVVVASLGDLRANSEADAYRKFHLKVTGRGAGRPRWSCGPGVGGLTRGRWSSC
jgi:hypothetical protein